MERIRSAARAAASCAVMPPARMLEMQLRSLSHRPRRGAKVRYMPSESAGAQARPLPDHHDAKALPPASSPISSASATRACAGDQDGASRNAACRKPLPQRTRSTGMALRSTATLLKPSPMTIATSGATIGSDSRALLCGGQRAAQIWLSQEMPAGFRAALATAESRPAARRRSCARSRQHRAWRGQRRARAHAPPGNRDTHWWAGRSPPARWRCAPALICAELPSPPAVAAARAPAASTVGHDADAAQRRQRGA